MLQKKIILLVFLLSGCSLFSPQVKKVNNVNCDAEQFPFIQKKLEIAHRNVIRCFTDHNRTTDAQHYKNILASREINVRCEPGKNPHLAVAEGPESKKFPLISVYNYKLVEKNADEYENAFFRESINWLGYENISDIDVAAIAEMCCLDHGNQKLNDAGKNACALFRFGRKDFTTPAYLKELSQNLEIFGHETEALQTTLTSAKAASRSNQKTDQVRRILFAPLEQLNAKALRKNLTRQQIQAYSTELGEVTQGIVLASIVDRTQDKALKKQSSAYLQTLVSRFYSNPIDREKVQFFTNVGDSIEAVIFKKSADLTKSWDAVKTRAEYVCRDLKKDEINSINELLGGVSYYVFEMKNEIPAGAMFDIATNWTKPCGQ